MVDTYAGLIIPVTFNARLAQIDELREDLKLLIEYSSHAKGAIIEKANQGGNVPIDKEGVKRCKKFVQKYGLRIG
jgi:hypothetical protein